MRLLDTNIFIHAFGSPHPLKEPCQEVLLLIENGTIDANIDVELLQEILHIYQYRGDTKLGLEAVSEVVDAFDRPIIIGLPEVLLAGRILVNHPSIQSRDAIHAAVVFEHRLEGIISADRAFDGIAGLRRFDPKELAA
jgi:predicted nucleic acid-binding protein